MDPATRNQWEPTWVHHSIYQADESSGGLYILSPQNMETEESPAKVFLSKQQAIESLIKRRQFKALWASIDPSTGKQWAPSWRTKQINKKGKISIRRKSQPDGFLF